MRRALLVLTCLSLCLFEGCALQRSISICSRSMKRGASVSDQ